MNIGGIDREGLFNDLTRLSLAEIIGEQHTVRGQLRQSDVECMDILSYDHFWANVMVPQRILYYFFWNILSCELCAFTQQKQLW